MSLSTKKPMYQPTHDSARAGHHRRRPDSTDSRPPNPNPTDSLAACAVIAAVCMAAVVAASYPVAAVAGAAAVVGAVAGAAVDRRYARSDHDSARGTPRPAR